MFLEFDGNIDYIIVVINLDDIKIIIVECGEKVYLFYNFINLENYILNRVFYDSFDDFK